MGIRGIFCSVVQMSTIKMTVGKLKILTQWTHLEFTMDNTWVARKQNDREECCKNLHYDFQKRMREVVWMRFNVPSLTCQHRGSLID